jgi:DNA polymerase III subunit delta
MSGRFPSAILIVGDSFIAEERVKTLLADVRSKVKGEVFVQSYKLPDTPLEQIFSAARTLPFLAEFQVLRLQEVQNFKEKKSEAIADYLANPSATTLLVFEAWELAKDHALAALIAKIGQVVFLESAEKRSMGSRFVKEKFRAAGKTLGPGVLERLEDQAADAPAFIDSVIDQMILYSGDQNTVTEDMLDQFEENHKEPNIFALTDAIAGRKVKDAIICLKQILTQDEKEIIPLVGLLHWQIRRFWQAKALMEEGVPQSVIMKKCKIYPKQAPFFWRQLQQLSRKKLEQALEGLFDLDWALKSGRSEGAVDLEKWVIQTAG